MPNFILNYYLFVYIFLNLLLTEYRAHSIESIHFTNDTYTGYISENIAQILNPSQTLLEQSKRHNTNSLKTDKKSIYIRFIDELKPSIQFLIKNLDDCINFNFKSLNLTLKTNDYDQESISLFEIDHDNYLCTKTSLKCLCFFQIRLTDDPFIRDRINREAKDSYQFYLLINNQTQTSINVNILDDNDLEPMFDPSEYTLEINQFDSNFNLVNLPEFSVIGRVSAMDPDLAENAQIKYYSNLNPYFGVISDTGEIYLKKSSEFLFNLNETEFNMEVKAIDSGIKFNLINNLIKLNQSCLDNINKIDDFNNRLVEIGSNLDPKKILQISNNLNQVTSFELAQIKINLNRNLKTIFEELSTYPRVKQIDLETRRLISFNNYRLPIRVINFEIVKIKNLIDYLKIDSESNEKFKLEPLSDTKILLSLEIDLNLSFISNETKKFKIKFCVKSVCFDLSDLEINFLNDITDALGSICSFNATSSQNSIFKINKFTSPGYGLFNAQPNFDTVNLCKFIYLENSKFYQEFSLNDQNYLKLGPKSQVILNEIPKNNQSFELKTELKLKIGNSSILISQTKFNFVTIYDETYDFITVEPLNKIIYFKDTTKTALFDNDLKILGLNLKLKNGSYEESNQNIFKSNFVQTFRKNYSEVLVVSKQNLERILVVNGFVNDKIQVLVSNKKYPSQKLLGIFTDKIDGLNLTIESLESNDSKCYQIDHSVGHLYLKCKLPQSLNFKKKFPINSQKSIRQLNLYSNDKFLISLEIEFNIQEQIKKIDDLSIEIQPINIKFLNPSPIQDHFKYLKVNKETENLVRKINSRRNIFDFNQNLARVMTNRHDFINLEYSIKNLKDCEMNKVIWRIERESNEKIAIFNLTEIHDLFIVDPTSGDLKFKIDFKPVKWSISYKFNLKINITETNFINFTHRPIDLSLELRPEFTEFSDLVHFPKLNRHRFYLQIDKNKLEKSKDLLLVKSFDLKPQTNEFNVSYSIRSSSEIPFYLDSTGRLFYFNSQTLSKLKYEFQVVLKLKFNLNDKIQYEEIAYVHAEILSNTPEIQVKNINESLETTMTFNLDIPVHSSNFVLLGKSPLIGFISFSDLEIYKYSFDLNTPKFHYQRPLIKRTRFTNTSETEQDLINDCFLSLISVDEQTGAVYFNTEQLNTVNLYSKMSKLLNFFYMEKNLTSKLISFNVQVYNLYFKLNVKISIDLIFHLNLKKMSIPSGPEGLSHVNKLSINSNNLLNLFRNGDEFLLSLEVEENSPTWPAYLEFNQADQEGFIVNLKEYFRTKLNPDKKNYLINLQVLENTRFYILNDAYFQITDNLNGLVQTKYSIQFDYEIERCYLTKILVVQYLNDYSFKSDNSDDLIFEPRHEPSHFSYWLDLNIRIVNLLDEPFITSEPVYFVNVDENEGKNKKLLTIKLLDYDLNSLSSDGRFKSQILAGNPQGLFYMNGLSLYTSSSSRKLDRETRAVHELEIKISENSQEFNSSRYALCKIIINVNDINDNRPIVNDIELDIYDKLDLNLVKKIPIANAIAIDQDLIAKLTYSVVSVKILDDSKSKRNVPEESEESKNTTSENDLGNYFNLNSTTGALYVVKSEMPCHSCSVQILYKANDIGRFKTRTSRKSYIKLNVMPLPDSTGLKTFELLNPSDKGDNIISLDLNEDVKLGEKVHQVKTKLINENQKSILYFNLIEESNLNSTFYLSNHDGSLYLIKKLDAEEGYTHFNLSILITNWLGQNEYVFIEVNVRDTNDNRPEFSSSLIQLDETIQIESSTETILDLVEVNDRDELDRNKLTYKLEDCFYVSHSILIKKPYIPSIGINPSTNHLNYPLCSKEFIELISSSGIKSTQLIRLKINLNEFRNYLENSSDLYTGNKNGRSILFIMDLSVKDSSSFSPTLARVKLNLTLEKESTLIFKRQTLENGITENDEINFGFKKEAYFIPLRSVNQLEKGAKIINLFNEFVYTNSNSTLLNVFKPFDVEFYALNNSDNVFNLDKNFGLIFLNKSIKKRVDEIFEIEVGCKTKFLTRSKKLFSTTKILVSILKQVKNDLPNLKYPILSVHKLVGYVSENSPIGSFVKLRPLGEYMKIFDELNLDRELFTFKLKNENFEIDNDSGLIKVKTEINYEIKQEYLVHFEICSKIDSNCFDINLELKIIILNQNDNEPSVIKLSPERVILSSSDLLRSMSLFKFKTEDLDLNLNNLSNKITQIKTLYSKNCSNSTQLDLNSFEIIKIFNTEIYSLKLTDLGYDLLLFLTNKKQCSLQIKLIIQTTDSLFMNFVNFNLSLEIEDHSTSILNRKSYPIVPILHTIELLEGSIQTPTQILDLVLVLDNYLKTRKYSDNLEFKLELLTYENLFYINETTQFLFIRPNSELDREHRDTYELFITVNTINKLNIPEKIRILVKVNDINDNRPIFINPPEAKFTLKKLAEYDFYEYNGTFLIAQVLTSSKSNPLFTIQAIDIDLAENSLVSYSLESEIFKIDPIIGSIYFIGNESNLTEKLYFYVKAKNQGSPSQESRLKIGLNLINSTQGVFFKTTFYSFKIDFNSKLVNKTIGYVNSAVFFSPTKSRLIYLIIEGDNLQDFKLSPLTGQLSLRNNYFDTLKPFYEILIEARSEFGNFKSQIWTKIEVLKPDNLKLEFAKFEYEVNLDENTAKMSEIFKLNTTDPNSNFKLLNNLDLFYINEYSGSVFNKQMFDYESEPKEYYLKIKAYNPMFETYCLLVVKINNLNDNRPEFDKSMYFAQIELDEDDSMIYHGSLNQALLDNSNFRTVNLTHQFVTKITADDLDADLIFYKIKSQSLLMDSLEYKNQLIESSLFEIDSEKGLVMLNTQKFRKFKQFFKFLNENFDSEDFNFNLKIIASDLKYSTMTQLNVNVKTMEINRPEFKSDLIKVDMDFEKYESNSKLIDIKDHLKIGLLNRIVFKVNFEGFKIESSHLLMDKNQAKNISSVKLPILACDKIQTGLCDQALIVFNISGISMPLNEPVLNGPITGFISDYAVYSTQQQFVTINDYQYVDSTIEDDYYMDEELSDANERFYYELKAYDLPEYLKYEFDILSCDFQLLNLSITNSTLLKQLKQFTLSKQFFRLNPNQVKQLFLLNKHNGVLSSRKIINYMNPGVYNFNISLKVLSKNEQNETVVSPILDSVKFKLIILPAVTSLKNEINKNDFKFEKEFYKFKFNKSNNKLGVVRVVNKFNKSLNFSVEYKLVDNKFKILNDLFKLDEESLTFLNNANKIKPYLNEDNEIVINLLCLVSMQYGSLEFMKEIVVDFSSHINSEPQVIKISPIRTSIQFPKIQQSLRIYENLPKGTVIFKIMTITESHDEISYFLENENFILDQKTGLLKVSKLDGHNIRLNVSACKSDECVYTDLFFELIKRNNKAPRFDYSSQNGSIREDVLPGTVITTLSVRDEDKLNDNSKLEYFILEGDSLNQFAISTDAKVYTRQMLDKEKHENYELYIMAFDGKFKSLIKLFIKILNVDDSRSICHENTVNLEVKENLKIKDIIYTVNASSLNSGTNSNYEIFDQFENLNLIEHLPFGINENSGSIYLTESLDFESKNFYNFYILISFNKLNKWTEKCFVKINVEILDVNDNKPEFSFFDRKISILENSPIGSILNFTYETNDFDSLNNSIVHYSLKNDSLFKIDSLNGLIQVKSENLDREIIGDEINLVILASNLDNLNSTFNLNVRIDDLNDNKPYFDRSEYYITIQENLPINFEIGQIKAYDPDLNPKTEYYLKPEGKFYIDRNTGIVYLNGSIDYELEKQFILEITAVDPEITNMENNSTTKLTIDIIDLNDNAPVFDPLMPKELNINENTQFNTTVLTISAHDSDHSDKNNKLSFKILNGTEYFGIDEFTGRLYVTKEFDYENLELKTFSILIECSDNGEQGALKSILELRINIIDINDNEPVFSKRNQTAIIKETFPLGDEIIKFSVSDKDSFGQIFTFSIMEQFKTLDEEKRVFLSEPIFSIKNNSLILVKRPLSNQKYGLKIRCYDSGLPSPLYSDTFITVIITDESNTEPKLNETKIDIVMIENFAAINKNQVIGQLRAVDQDKGDILYYELNSPLIEVNQLNGLLRAKEDIAYSSSLDLIPKVTDKKFIIESQLGVNFRTIKRDCIFNSLYAKFNLYHSDEIFDLEKFIKNNSLLKIREHLQKMIVLNSKMTFNLTIEIIGLRIDNAKSQEIFDLNHEESLENFKSTLIEVLFIVKKLNFNSGRTECVNSKYMSKILNKKKPILVKKLKMQMDLRLKLNDLSYNNECSDGNLIGQVCSTNLELQTCQLKFNGYNQHDLCDSSNLCYLLPSYDWSCENRVETQNNEMNKIGQACRKNPCKNNGLCKMMKSGGKKINTTIKNRVHCFCPNGFKGKFCEKDVNECEETGLDSSQWINPCHPTANCINTQGSYICNCSLEPSSLCYNTLSPQYTASVAAFKNDKSIKKYSNSFKKFNNDDEQDFIDEDEDYDERLEQVTLFGYHIPNHVIQQALLGIFGGICAILVMLSLAAGIVCKINFSKGYMDRIEVRHDAMTSNTSVDHDGFTSSSSSPCTFKLEAKKPVNKYKNSRFNRNKQRSSMTASLISSNTIESNSDTDRVQRKNFKYRINNLFFSKNEKLRGLQEANKEESEEIESSSAYSPKSDVEVKYKIDITKCVIESNSLLKHEHDADDEDFSTATNGLIRPVENFDTFGRSSFKTKYKTLDLKKINGEFDNEKVKFNTAIKRPAKKEPVKQYTTFLPKLPNHLIENTNENDKESIASNEDSCLGFYWDITDWAGNLENLDDSKQNTYLPVQTEFNAQTSNNLQGLSPIYSRVFKINKMEKVNEAKENHDDDTIQDCDVLNDDSLDVNLINDKLNSQKVDNYMYLTRNDCNQTLESIRTQTNTEANISEVNNDEETANNHYFTSTFKTS
ncbi:unnamed protein product [Brachionus calyciflorus]|uniref:Uncharacterized protein n=1 Tax=Brachionus calyciflorus TaxID=104777 RepID=A0A813T9B4_9BILA|nr:unnamed protein product [Brachionus calyciflorus]